MRQLTLWHSATAWQTELTAHAVGESTPLPYPGMQDVPAAARWLSAMLQQPVALTFTDNRSTMVSYRYTVRGVRLRLHRIFLGADEALMGAVVGFVQGDRAAGKALDRFLAQNAEQVGGSPPMPIRTRGDVHDLAAIFTEVNATYFHTACTAAITWGQQARPRGLRSLQLGVYLSPYKLICLHPCLDQAFVPRFYVAWVVFHEMLHELFGVDTHKGRRRVHSPEFVAVETSHPDYVRCRAWEEANLRRLMKYRPPPGSPRGVRRVPPVRGAC